LRVLPFQEWWNEIVFVDDQKQKMSRRDLVLALANQDGGAHVDPKLNETYARLSRHNSMGWTNSDGTTATAIPSAERAAMRQIAHELLATLDPSYRRKTGPLISGDDLWWGNDDARYEASSPTQAREVAEECALSVR
jgi:hypothetical protein